MSGPRLGALSNNIWSTLKYQNVLKYFSTKRIQKVIIKTFCEQRFTPKVQNVKKSINHDDE